MAFFSTPLELPEITVQIGTNSFEKCQWRDLFDIFDTSGNTERPLLFNL